MPQNLIYVGIDIVAVKRAFPTSPRSPIQPSPDRQRAVYANTLMAAYVLSTALLYNASSSPTCKRFLVV